MSLAGSAILEKGVKSGISPMAFISRLKRDERQELGKHCLNEYLKPGSGEYTMDFVTLGMFIIDEIHYPPPKPPVKDIIGGAGSYAAIGARFLRRSGQAHLIGWAIHVGSDFPPAILQQIQSWGTDIKLIDTKNRLTTRAWNKYDADEHRDFKYLTPKLRVDHTQLSPKQLLSKIFHLVCAPARCMNLVNGILNARQELKASGALNGDALSGRKNVPNLRPFEPPIFVWEPVPDCCIPEELPNILEALKLVDVISPNHQELRALFGETGPDLFGACELAVIERQCNELLSKGFGKKPSAVVVRRGDRGCYVASNTRHSWFPAYHRPREDLDKEEQKTWTQKVVDPTGGGNAFLGGFCIGLLDVMPEDKTEFENAAICGSVAASFAIKQYGMPSVSRTEDGEELWNGESVKDRLTEFCKRLPLERLSEEAKVKASLYGPCPALVFGEAKIRMERIPADFDGNPQFSTDHIDEKDR